MVKNIIFKNSIFIFLLLANLGIINNAFASTSFSEQFISGGTAFYFPDSYFDDDLSALSLEGSLYKSDSEKLYATLILHGKSGMEGNNTLSYGMLIDADTNFDTGVNGFDYLYKVMWSNGTWVEIYQEIPTKGPLKMLEQNNIDNVFTPDIKIDNQPKSTVDLELDLRKIGSPDLYAIVFFTEGNLIGKIPLVQDVLSLAVIPPLDFTVTTHPFPLSFESSTEKDVHIFIDTTFTENAEIYYNISSNSDDVSIKEISDNSIFLQNGKAEIPFLLKDIGHDDIQVHELTVSLNPWYAVNPETNDAERGGEIFESYNFRNQQKSETFTIIWTSLPQPTWDIVLIVQVAMLSGTIFMVGIGIITYRSNFKFATHERKDKHTQDLIPVYDIMRSLISKVNHYTKQITLQYPENEDDRYLVRTSPSELHTKRDMKLQEFNHENITFYNSALKHLKKYKELNRKWTELQSTLNQYDELVESLKSNIKEICLKTIHEKLPTFQEFKGGNENAYYIDAIVFEAYGVLEDAMQNRHPRTSPNVQFVKNSDFFPEVVPAEGDESGEYHAFLSSTLFFSLEPFPNEINEILGCVLQDSLKEKYRSLIELEQKSKFQLDAFRIDIKSLLKDLNAGKIIDGKCDLGY